MMATLHFGSNSLREPPSTLTSDKSAQVLA